MLTIGILALEPSADILGADLMQALLSIRPDIQFIGVGGPRMASIGFRSLYSFSALSHMGFVEVLKHLRTLLSARRYLLAQFIREKVDAFIGIDAPDFNSYLEERLHRKFIHTIHYVSPSVWAWRSGRVHRIKRDVDLLLTLFPFEAKFYEQHKVPVKFVGHPLADMVDLDVNADKARTALAIKPQAKVIALFPGSRSAEIKYMGRVFLQAAQQCYAQNPDFYFIVTLPNEALKQQLLLQCEALISHLPLKIQVGNSQQALAAADVVLVKSGTVTLEALLYKKPMVISFIGSSLSFWIARRLVNKNLKYIGLPNLLADKSLVPEILQEDAKPEALAQALLAYFADPQKSIALKAEYERIHQQLRLNASQTAAHAVLALLGEEG